MEENLHDIDKLFRSSVDGYEEAPPENVWDAVNAGLDKSSIISIKKKYTNLKRVAVALLILLLGTIAYEIGTRSGGGGDFVKKGDEVNTVDKGDKVNGGDEVNNVNKVDKVDKVDKVNIVDKDKDRMNRGVESDKPHAPVNPDPSANDKTQLAQQGDPLDKQNLPGNNKKQRNKNNTTHQVVINVVNPGQDDTNDNADDNGTGAKNNVNSRPQRLMAENIMVTKAQYTATLPVLRKLPSAPTMDYQSAANKKIMIKKESPASRFTLGVFYGPQFSFNRLENDHHDDRRGPGQPPGNDKDDIKNNEQRQSAYSFGISVEYAAGKNWAVESGLALLNKQIHIEPKKIYAKADANGEVKYRFDCSSGYSYLNPKTSTTPTVGDSISVSESENTLQYLTVPVAVKYKLNAGKFTISPTLGAAANFVTKQKISTEYTVASVKQSQTINNIEGLKPVYYNGFAGVSFDYKLKKNVSVSVMPSGNFALSSINKNAAVRSYPNAFGLSFGLKIKL